MMDIKCDNCGAVHRLSAASGDAFVVSVRCHCGMTIKVGKTIPVDDRLGLINEVMKSDYEQRNALPPDDFATATEWVDWIRRVPPDKASEALHEAFRWRERQYGE